MARPESLFEKLGTRACRVLGRYSGYAPANVSQPLGYIYIYIVVERVQFQSVEGAW